MSSTARADDEALEQQQLTQARSELGTFWHRCRSSVVTRRLQRDGVHDVVDVGAGAGHLGTWLHRRAPDITYRFVERNERLAAALAVRFSEAQQETQTSVVDAPAVVMLDVVEHVPDDHAFLSSWVERLRPGGLLVVTVPALPSLFSAWDEAMGHYRRYTKRTLRAAVRDLPLSVLECSYLFPELVPPAVVRRVARPRASETSPEFPVLPRPLDGLLYLSGRATASVRRVVPIGTSLVLVARRTDH
jgi:SAM-dependent methyltransferase